MESDPETVTDLFVVGDPTHIRLTERVVRILVEACGDAIEEAECPSFPDYDAAREASDEEYRKKREADVAAVTDVPPGPKVPSYKFESNDGWLLHPSECQLLADRVYEHVAEGRSPNEAIETVLLDTANLLQLGAHLGGVRVA